MSQPVQWLAVGAGVAIPTALSAGLALHLGGVLAAIGAEPLGSNPDAPIFDPERRRAVDWAAIGRSEVPLPHGIFIFEQL